MAGVEQCPYHDLHRCLYQRLGRTDVLLSVNRLADGINGDNRQSLGQCPGAFAGSRQPDSENEGFDRHTRCIPSPSVGVNESSVVVVNTQSVFISTTIEYEPYISALC